MIYRNNIASHVLKIIGPRPDSRPDRPGALNYHLYGLPIGDNSDLGTFRWDIFNADRTMPPALPSDDPHGLFPARQDYNHGQPPGIPSYPSQLASPQNGASNAQALTRFGPGGVIDPRQNGYPSGALIPQPQYTVGPTGMYLHNPHHQGIYGQMSY